MSLRLNTVPCHTDSATEKNISHITWNMFHASILISICVHLNFCFYSKVNDNFHFVCILKIISCLKVEGEINRLFIKIIASSHKLDYLCYVYVIEMADLY